MWQTDDHVQLICCAIYAQTHRHTHRHAHKHMHTQAHRHTQTCTHRHTDIHTMNMEFITVIVLSEWMDCNWTAQHYVNDTAPQTSESTQKSNTSLLVRYPHPMSEIDTSSALSRKCCCAGICPEMVWQMIWYTSFTQTSSCHCCCHPPRPLNLHDDAACPYRHSRTKRLVEASCGWWGARGSAQLIV